MGKKSELDVGSSPGESEEKGSRIKRMNADKRKKLNIISSSATFCVDPRLFSLFKNLMEEFLAADGHRCTQIDFGGVE